MTRLDTVRRIGSLLRLAFESRMPLSNYGASPNVTEPLLPMNPVVLARMILKKGFGIRDSGFGKAKQEKRALIR